MSSSGNIVKRDFEFEPGIEGDLIRVTFKVHRDRVVYCKVQLDLSVGGHLYPARRYDTHHGQAHLDTLDARGREIDKQWLDMSFNELLDYALADFKVQEHRDRYRRLLTQTM